MPGKRARRDFSQLSDFERGLIIRMKTAGWSTRRVAVQVDRSECVVRNCWEQWTREGTHARKTGSGASRKTTRREDRAASTCGPHSDSFNDTSRRRRSNCSTNNFQIPCRSKSYIQGPFPCTPFNTGTSVTASTVVPNQINVECQIGKRLCLVMNPGLFWGQMITIYVCGGALVSGTILPTLFYVKLPA
ncbi:transposable element Tcb2 transposase [Trichonephila clavipes]|nr:transposable element Tcb2 transposase [Trichonephila clavipes]